MGALEADNLENFSTDGDMVAFILTPNSRNDLNSVRAYIPKLMSNIDMKDDIWEKDLDNDNSCIDNDNFEISGGEEVVSRNYIYLNATTRTGRDTDIGEKGQRIVASFTDGDLNKGYYKQLYGDKESNTAHVNTRFRQFVENVTEFETSEEFQDNNPDLTHNIESNTSEGKSTSRKASSTRRNRAKQSSTSSTAGSGTGSASGKSGTATTSGNAGEARSKSMTDVGVTDTSKAGKTSSKKRVTDQFDLIMDTSNRVMGMRFGTNDYTGEVLTTSEEKIPQVILRERIAEDGDFSYTTFMTNSLGYFKLDEYGPLALMTNENKNNKFEIKENVLTATNTEFGTMVIDEEQVNIDYQKKDSINITTDHITAQNKSKTLISIYNNRATIRNKDNAVMKIDGDTVTLQNDFDSKLTMEKTVHLKDSRNNEISLVNNSITISNSGGSVVEIGSNEINLQAENIHLNAAGCSIDMSGGEITFSSSGGTCTLKDIIDHINSPHYSPS